MDGEIGHAVYARDALLIPEVEAGQLRDVQARAISAGESARYSCVVCESVLRVSASTVVTASHREHHYFFMHPAGPLDCPYKSNRRLTQDQISARRFNGKPEGKRHLRLKGLLHDSLKCDPAVRDIVMEGRVTHHDGSGNYRQPDLQATWAGHRFALECQVSTTAHQVMVERAQFYRENGIYLIWVTDWIQPEFLRLYAKDMITAHGGVFFLATESSLSESFRCKRFHLQARLAACGESGLLELREDMLCDFAALKLVEDQFLVTHPLSSWKPQKPTPLPKSDFTPATTPRSAHVAGSLVDTPSALSASLKPFPGAPEFNLETLWRRACHIVGNIASDSVHSRFLFLCLEVHVLSGMPAYHRRAATYRNLRPLIQSEMALDFGPHFSEIEVWRPIQYFLSAAIGKPLGTGYENLVSLCNLVAQNSPHLLKCFIAIYEHYGHDKQLNERWHQRVARAKASTRDAILNGKLDPFQSDPTWLAYCRLAFPDIEKFKPTAA